MRGEEERGPDGYRSGFVTIIGRPNVGKSTLMNALVGMELAITSAKPQTTRKNMRTVLTLEEGQLVFVDTPGIHKARNPLGEYMDRSAEKTINEVDCVLMLAEPVSCVPPGEKHILELLEKADVPAVLAINKIDTVKKNELLPAIDAYSKAFPFRHIVPVSAKNAEGLEELTRVLLSLMPEGAPLYDEDTVTEETERELVGELIRQAALRNLHDEVPHGVAVSIESMKEEERLWRISANIYCEKNSHKGMIIGKGGTMLKRIGSAARRDAEKLLNKHVALDLFVKVKKDWRESEKAVRSFGYRDETD
ncbi:MAG: GTPase Era [Lachnospiraceae bacterium]|nr:GTPase Era [Lachnospiraceae bacterium]